MRYPSIAASRRYAALSPRITFRRSRSATARTTLVVLLVALLSAASQLGGAVAVSNPPFVLDAAHGRIGDFAPGSKQADNAAALPSSGCDQLATDDRCELWTATDDWSGGGPVQPGYDRAWTSEISPDGDTVFVAGASGVVPLVIPPDSDLAVSAFDASTGARRWGSRVDGGQLMADYAEAIAVSPDNSRVYVVGTSQGQGLFSSAGRVTVGNYIATAALDAATGAPLWVNTYDGLRGFAVTVSPDGETIVVVGQEATSANYQDTDAIAIAYGSDGNQRWAKRLGIAIYGSGRDAAFSPSSDRVFVSGYGIDAGRSESDYVTAAFQTSNGTMLWRTRSGQGIPSEIAVDPQGTGVYLTGNTQNVPDACPSNPPGSPCGGTNYLTVALDAATGAQRWAAQQTGAVVGGVDIATSIAASTGRVFVGGFLSNTQFGDYDFGTIAYDSATGTRLWIAQYASARDERLWSIHVDGDQVAVAGRSGPPYSGGESGGPGTAWLTISYDTASGNTRWTAKVFGDETGSGDPRNVRVTAGGVYVGGTVLYPVERTPNTADFAAAGYAR